MDAKLPSFYHPTEILFVDDDLDAINNYSASLPSHFSIKSFTVPEEALAYINSSERVKPLHERCRPLVSDINHYEREMANARRFEECCMVIADYAMPSMNGIEFCKAIENPFIYKILLTGFADEKLAVKAFNDEIINRFFAKRDREVLSKLRTAIEIIQKDYFCRMSHYVNELIQCASPPFLRDEGFLSFFNSLLKDRKIYEYYLSHQPQGFVLINENGEISRLVIYTESDLNFQLEMAVSKHAPKELQHRLQQTEIKAIPYFWRHPFGVYDESCANWEDYFYPASTLEGKQTYYYSIIDNPPGYDELSKGFVGFFDYLEQLESDE